MHTSTLPAYPENESCIHRDYRHLPAGNRAYIDIRGTRAHAPGSISSLVPQILADHDHVVRMHANCPRLIQQVFGEEPSDYLQWHLSAEAPLRAAMTVLATVGMSNWSNPSKPVPFGSARLIKPWFFSLPARTGGDL